MSSDQSVNWLLRVGNGVELFNSSIFNIWGINESNCDSKFFLKKAKPGDCLWFVKGNSQGLIIAVAIFERSVKRVNGECMTYEQLGWSNFPGLCETDIYFKNFKKIENLNLKSQIKSPKVVRQYNEKCLVNLPEMYSRIYPEEEEVIRVKKFTFEGVQYLKSVNGNIYDIQTHDLVGTYIDDVFTIYEEESDDTEIEEILNSDIIQQNISVDGVNYLVTTNADVRDETTRRFIDSLVSSEELSDDEDAEEGIFEEKESLRRILTACAKITNEIAQLTSSLNIRLANL
jgi:hypothetical protein